MLTPPFLGIDDLTDRDAEGEPDVSSPPMRQKQAAPRDAQADSSPPPSVEPRVRRHTRSRRARSPEGLFTEDSNVAPSVDGSTDRDEDEDRMSSQPLEDGGFEAGGEQSEQSQDHEDSHSRSQLDKSDGAEFPLFFSHGHWSHDMAL